MKSSVNIRFFFPLTILAVNVLFLLAMILMPEAYFLQNPLYLEMNFGLFAFSLFLILIWGGFQWSSLVKKERNFLLSSEEEVFSNPYIRRPDRLNKEENKDSNHSGNTIQSYLTANGWNVLNNEDSLS